MTTSIYNCTPANVMVDFNVHSETGKHFVRNGSTPSCIILPNILEDLFCNPLMLSGTDQNVNIHYGLDPVYGFHLSHAYIPFKQSTTSTTTVSGDIEKVSSDALYINSFRQFSDWCSALYLMLSASIYKAKTISKLYKINPIKMFIFAGSS